MAILKTENLKKYYGKDTTLVKALNGVDLEVESEEELLSVVVAVLSPQAATEASITMPDRAAMERTRMFFCMIIT